MTSLNINIPGRDYNVTVGKGLIGRINDFFPLKGKVLILTDDGVPKEYSEAVSVQYSGAEIMTVPMGEGSKSLGTLETVLKKMADMGMSRSDALVTVGGGMVGDLGGFAAATYMRGIDFYNIPTTLLSTVDASVGGKTAVNLGTLKNIVGAFHQPKGVLIDTDTLSSLSDRLYAEGLAEVIKMAMTSDITLFEKLESYTKEEIKENIEGIIYSALSVKKAVVEADEKEGGLRKILNFGHTLGHAIEAQEREKGLYHGECVALGMLAVCEGESKDRLIKLLKKVGLPYEYGTSAEALTKIAMHDKKRCGEKIDLIWVGEIGSYEIKSLGKEEIKALADIAYGGGK